MGKNNVLYYITEGARSIFRHSLMSFAAICMIVACLLIMGSFSLVALNLDNLLSDLENKNEFYAYVEENLSDNEARSVHGRILSIDGVADATFIHRETAMQNFLADVQDNPLFTELPATTFRHRYAVRVENIGDMRAVSVAVGAVAGIANVSAELELAEGFVAVRNVATGIAVVLILMLFAVSLFIISNTIRLTTFSRRDEIAIMKMCGATNSFVRWPFIVEGLLIGLIGATVAFFAQWGIYNVLVNAVGSAEAIQIISLIPFRALAPQIAGIFAGVGFLVGAGGSSFAIGRFLKV